MTPHRAAIVGLGRIADALDDELAGYGVALPLSHMGAYAEVPEIAVVGAADIDPARRAAFGDRWGMPDVHLHASTEELLRAEQPEIVSVCTTALPRPAIVREIVDLTVRGVAGV